MISSNPIPAPDQGPKEVAAKLLDSPGYLLFSAHLRPDRDKEGHNLIQFNYRRYHFSLEDSKEAILQLKKFVDEEIRQLYEESGGDEP